MFWFCHESSNVIKMWCLPASGRDRLVVHRSYFLFFLVIQLDSVSDLCKADVGTELSSGRCNAVRSNICHFQAQPHNVPAFHLSAALTGDLTEDSKARGRPEPQNGGDWSWNTLWIATCRTLMFSLDRSKKNFFCINSQRSGLLVTAASLP